MSTVTLNGVEEGLAGRFSDSGSTITHKGGHVAEDFHPERFDYGLLLIGPALMLEEEVREVELIEEKERMCCIPMASKSKTYSGTGPASRSRNIKCFAIILILIYLNEAPEDIIID